MNDVELNALACLASCSNRQMYCADIERRDRGCALAYGDQLAEGQAELYEELKRRGILKKG